MHLVTHALYVFLQANLHVRSMCFMGRKTVMPMFAPLLVGRNQLFRSVHSHFFLLFCYITRVPDLTTLHRRFHIPMSSISRPQSCP